MGAQLSPLLVVPVLDGPSWLVALGGSLALGSGWGLGAIGAGWLFGRHGAVRPLAATPVVPGLLALATAMLVAEFGVDGVF